MTILRTMKPPMSPRTTQEDNDILISSSCASGERLAAGRGISIAPELCVAASRLAELLRASMGT